MNDWTTIDREMPEDSEFVIANVKDGNNFYHEILCYKREENKWYFHDGRTLPDGIKVTAWRDVPSTFVN